MYPALPLVSSTLNLGGSRWSPEVGKSTVSLESCIGKWSWETILTTYQYQSNCGRSDIAFSIVTKFLAASPIPVTTGVIGLLWGNFISSLST